MTDRTLGIIYALKRSNHDGFRAVAEYISRETGDRIEDYSFGDLCSIVRTAYKDYISGCDNAGSEFDSFLRYLDMNYCGGVYEAMMCRLRMTQVKSCNKENPEMHYINGFRDPTKEIKDILKGAFGNAED